VLYWIDTKLAQLSVARIQLPLAELLEELMRAVIRLLELPG
jgi:hypothetical protein